MMFSGLFQKVIRNRVLGLSMLLLLVAFIYERVVRGNFVISDIFVRMLNGNALTNSLPNFSPLNLVRIVIISISSLLLVAYVYQHRTPHPASSASRSHWLFKLAQWAGWIVALACLIIFLINPVLFAKATAEDYIVEDLSALGLFAGFGLMLIVFALEFLSRKQVRYKGIVLGIAGFMALVLFVSGMEEVSWFQRTFHYATPTFLSSNTQHEANLHNLDSKTSEQIYYVGSFVLLILIPFVADQSDLLNWIPGIKLFVPNITVLFSCALLSAYNYNLWNRTSIQFAFFATLWILVFYSVRAFQEKSSLVPWRYFPILVLGLFVISQVIFLWQGSRFVQTWNVTEYREMIMPYGYVVWTLEILRRAWLEFQQNRAAHKVAVPQAKAAYTTPE